MQRTFEISIGAATELWIQWAWIALDQRDSARVAHERAGGPPASNPELQAAMVSIVAAASAIDGFARVVRDAGAEPTLSPTAKDPSRATYIWETLRANFKMAKPTQTWPRELKELWKLRSGVDGGLVHPRTIAPEPEPFPPYLDAPARRTYTVQSATRSTAVMGEIFTTCTPEAVRPGLADLCQRVQGFTIAGYIEEFARRGALDGLHL